MAFSTMYCSAVGKMQGYFLKGESRTINLEIPEESIVGISLDQSSSSTGVYIREIDSKFQVIGHIERRGQEKSRYYQELFAFFSRNLRNVKVGIFITEQHTKYKKFDRALPVLMELKGHINSWRYTIPALEAVPSDSWVDIPPPTWKSQVVDPSKGKNRFNDKREIALDLLDLLPELTPYFNTLPTTSDYDGFDALGIYEGYIRANWNEDGRIISGTKNYQGDLYLFTRPFQESVNTVEEIIKDFDIQHATYGTVIAQYNPDRSYYENAFLAASGQNCTITVVTDPQVLLSLSWMYGYQLPTAVVMAICRASGVKKSEREYLCTKYNMEEISTI